VGIGSLGDGVDRDIIIRGWEDRIDSDVTDWDIKTERVRIEKGRRIGAGKAHRK
jgi:hypothetical protein